jgi:hypothetical protein
MTTNNLLKLGVAGACLALFGCEGDVSFSEDIQPILEASCIQCHDNQAEGELVSGLSLKTYDDLLQGTQYGKVVVPGSAMSSALYLTVAGKTAPEIRMPPHNEESFATGKGEMLSARQIELIERWINEGAPNN